METTFVMIKPNGVSHGLVGDIINRYEKSRLSLSALSIKNLPREKVEEFYGEHRGKPFFEGLVQFMSSGPVVLLALHGENAVERARTLNGATNPEQAAPGTIRFDYAPNVSENIVHSSDSVTSAQREVHFWFQAHELVSYAPKSFKCKS